MNTDISRRQFNATLASLAAGGNIDPVAIITAATNIPTCSIAELRQINEAAELIESKNYWLNWAIVCWTRGEDVETGVSQFIGPLSHKHLSPAHPYEKKTYMLLQKAPIWQLLKSEKTPENFAAISEELQKEDAANRIAYGKRTQALEALSKRDIREISLEDFNPRGWNAILFMQESSEEIMKQKSLQETMKRTSRPTVGGNTQSRFSEYTAHFLQGTLKQWADKERNECSRDIDVAERWYTEQVEKGAGQHYKPQTQSPVQKQVRDKRVVYNELKEFLKHYEINRPTIQDMPRLDGYVITMRTAAPAQTIETAAPDEHRASVSGYMRLLDSNASITVSQKKDPGLHKLSPTAVITVYPSNHVLGKLLQEQLEYSERMEAYYRNKGRS